MFKEGTIVTLSKSKEHFDGTDTMSLKEGVCGLVVRSRKKITDHEYVVDFGAYGQWNCVHSELSGDDSEGWDNPIMVATPFRFDNDQDVVQQLFGAFTAQRPQPGTGVVPEPVWTLNEEQDAFIPDIDVEADIARRTAELERGIE